MNNIKHEIDVLLNELERLKTQLLDDTYNYAIIHGFVVRLKRLKNIANEWTKKNEQDYYSTVKQIKNLIKAFNNDR